MDEEKRIVQNLTVLDGFFLLGVSLSGGSQRLEIVESVEKKVAVGFGLGESFGKIEDIEPLVRGFLV